MEWRDRYLCIRDRYFTLFGAYQAIKALEEKGKTRKEVMSELLEKFGEKNPEVNVMAT
jgi:hypothetical protein